MSSCVPCIEPDTFVIETVVLGDLGMLHEIRSRGDFDIGTPLRNLYASFALLHYGGCQEATLVQISLMAGLPRLIWNCVWNGQICSNIDQIVFRDILRATTNLIVNYHLTRSGLRNLNFARIHFCCLSRLALVDDDVIDIWWC